MMKSLVLYAALVASAVALLSTAAVHAEPLPALPDVPPDMSAVDRNLAALFHAKLVEVQEERAWAMGLR